MTGGIGSHHQLNYIHLRTQPHSASHSERRPCSVGLHVGGLRDLSPFLPLLREISPELLGRSAVNVDRETHGGSGMRGGGNFHGVP